jgi:hypothetical protein
MRVLIEIECDNASFEDSLEAEVSFVLGGAVMKILKQLSRKPCVCDAPEVSDKLLDSNGNTVGRVVVER